MKDLSPRWAAITLLTPVILILSLILLANLNRARAAKVKTAVGTVVVGFTGSVVQVDNTDTPIPNPPPLPFQHVYINVISVRLNPSTSDIVSDSEGGWQTIPVPAGVGNSTTSGLVETGLNFGGNVSNSQFITLGEGRSEIQIDAAQLPQTPILFNAFPVRADNYNQVELVLDSSTFLISVSSATSNQQIGSNAGNVIPLCGAAGTIPSGDGCNVYPITIFNPASTIGVANSPVEVGRQGLVPLMINIQVDVGPPFPATGAPVIIQPHISVVQNNGTSQSGQPLNQDLGLIEGTVNNFATNNKTLVTAELAGTDNVVEQYNVQSTGPLAGNYTLYLPAPTAGASYDLYASGPGRAYDLKSAVTVLPGSQNTAVNFNTPTENTVTLTGTISDACVPQSAVEAATIQLLEPDPAISPVPDCTANPPTGCVVVATSASDEGGTYPLPGSGNVPAPFQNVPINQNQNYTMLINSAGFDPLVTPVQSSSSNLTCPGGSGGACNFLLSHGYLAGTLSLSSPSTSPLSAMVMAEDTGTNNIQNFAQVIVPPSQGTAGFSMLVPDGVSNFDLFATVQDDFEGQPQLQSMHTPQQNTGHSIAVEADIPAPAACATTTAPNPLGPVSCIGHGSLEGALNDPTDLTSVVLEKPDPSNPSDLVQTIAGVVGPFGSDSSGGYAMCAPPESDYTIQRFDDGVAGEATEVGAMNTPVVVPTAAPSASFTPTPCAGICDAGQGTSCLICTETGGPSL